MHVFYHIQFISIYFALHTRRVNLIVLADPKVKTTYGSPLNRKLDVRAPNIVCEATTSLFILKHTMTVTMITITIIEK